MTTPEETAIVNVEQAIDETVDIVQDAVKMVEKARKIMVTQREKVNSLRKLYEEAQLKYENEAREHVLTKQRLEYLAMEMSKLN